MSRQQTRRKCRCCTKFFIPDPRNQSRQHYCPQPACRQASKAASQRRWLSKAANRDYFRGADQVRRVQLWRKSHPGYWRKKAPSSQGTQAVESQSANLAQASCNVPRALPVTLQDFCLAQDPAFVGLISMVMMNKQIAARLGTTEITVKIQRGSVMKKMKATSVADLVRLADKLGIEATS